MRSHRRFTRRKDQTVRLVLELRIQNRLDRILHRCSLPRQEHLRLHPQRRLRRTRELARCIQYKLPGTPQTRQGRVLLDILVRREQWERPRVATLVVVHVEDAEQVLGRDVLSIQEITVMDIRICSQTCEHYLAVRVRPHYPPIAGHEQSTPLTVRLVSHRVPAQNVVRAVLDNVPAFQRDRVVEQVARRLELGRILLQIGQR